MQTKQENQLEINNSIGTAGYARTVGEDGKSYRTGISALVSGAIGGDIEDLENDISALQTTTGNHTTQIGNLQTAVGTNTGDITDLKEDLENLSASAVPTTVRQAIKTLFESGAYADTGLTDEMAVISSWASQVTAITLNQSSIGISGATTSQLTATTTPAGGTVTWSSSDTSVATVSSSGLVTGVSNGTATITATSGDVSATCAVTVSGIATLSSISAVYTQSGTVYDTDTLDSLKTDLVVTATYSDSSTATVASADYTLSGTLTEGTSTITVSYGGKTTTFTVTVTHDQGKSDMNGWTDGVAYTDIEVIQNSYYAAANGSINSYPGWDRTGYVPCHGASSITFPPMDDGTSKSESNGFFDENHICVQHGVILDDTQYKTIEVPANAYYFGLSSTAASLAECLAIGPVPHA